MLLPFACVVVETVVVVCDLVTKTFSVTGGNTVHDKITHWLSTAHCLFVMILMR